MKKLIILLILPLFLISCRGCGKRKVEESSNIFCFRTIDGRKYTFDELKGKVVLVEFFASWCSACVKAIPFVSEIYEKYKGKGLFVVGLSFDSKDLDAIKKSLHIEYPVGYAPEPLARHFRVVTLPTFYIFDRNGKLAGKFVGYSDKLGNFMRVRIEKLLEGG